MVDVKAPRYFAIHHTPGPNWVEGTPYDLQLGFDDHVAYIADCRDQGRVVPANPFREASGDASGTLAVGNATIFRAVDLAEATRLGTDDPTVRSGMLNVEVKPWSVPFHG